MNRLIASLLIVLCFVTLTSGQQTPPSIAPSNFHLFMLAGQSNMAGRGKVESIDRVPHPRVLMLNRQGKWVPAIDPMHFDKPKVVGVGPGKTFAVRYAESNPNVIVGLIPCAAGGSPIATWQPRGYHSQTKSYPYDNAIARTQAAMKSGVLKGILWHQGESDSKAVLSSRYESELHDLIQRLRTDLKVNDVPFIAGQMGQFKERPWSSDKRRVDSAHRALTRKVANAGFANSDALSHRGDEVHFDSASYRELGKRYYDVFKAVVDQSSK